MGTNYYVIGKECPTCGHKSEKMHLGKQSCGWQFHFRGYRDKGLISREFWIDYITKNKLTIIDEYGNTFPLRDFFASLNLVNNKLNVYNIARNLPMNDKEKEYLERCPHTDDPSLAYEWKDDEGFAFTDWEFC